MSINFNEIRDYEVEFVPPNDIRGEKSFNPNPIIIRRHLIEEHLDAENDLFIPIDKIDWIYDQSDALLTEILIHVDSEQIVAAFGIVEKICRSTSVPICHEKYIENPCFASLDKYKKHIIKLKKQIISDRLTTKKFFNLQ